MLSRSLFIITLLFAQASLATTIYKGASRTVGNGKAYVWVETDKRKVPQAIGIALSKDALSGLPDGEMPTEYLLPLPKGVRVPPYQHISLDWNPHGHEPNPIYSAPHFDLHLYMISKGKREAISCMGSDLARCEARPDAKYIPESYIQTPGGVPKMGAHWVDPRSDEFNGRPFTATFIYGFYNGKMNFLEPMFTRAYLESEPQLVRDVPQPVAFRQAGHYPKQFEIIYDEDADLYLISLTQLEFHRAN